MTFYLLDPGPWVEGTILEDWYDPDEAGFYHVTTAATAVAESRVLLSRRQSKRIGLGGGFHNEAPNSVSVLFDFSRAMWLWSAVRTAARAVQGELGAAEVVQAVLEWMDFPDRPEWQDLIEEQPQVLLELADALGLDVDAPEETLATTKGWNQALYENAEKLDNEFLPGADRYELIRIIEQVFDEFRPEEYFYDNACLPTVGFTAPAKEFVKILPDEVSIVQVGVREGAPADMVLMECELRFEPKDLMVVRVRAEEFPWRT